MQVTFVGGPWHGASKRYPEPLPSRIEASGRAVYVPWASHPSTAGVQAEPLAHAGTYVLESLEPPELLRRVEEVLLHKVPASALRAAADASARGSADGDAAGAVAPAFDGGMRGPDAIGRGPA